MLELLVQTKTGVSNLASTVVAFDNNTVAGNSIIVVSGNSSSTAGDVSTVTDTQGNTYTKVITTANATVGEIEIWYASGIIGGANTVTVAYTTGVACAVIIREYYGLLYANTADKSVGNTGNSNSLSSGNTTALTQNAELLVGAGLIPLANSFSAGSGFVNLVSAGAPLVVAVAAEDLFVTSGGVQSATFGANASIQWVCVLVTFYLLPTGTTTSTSSTSASTFSTSSTSSSISSTSSSTSSTSASSSTSSTSSSISSTSSSISSTSSSTSSTSMSSTSSSTSLSSTSSSISSTSFSSTSMSSTSSSTSVSSTSTSFSSTSSSISSTSSSVSSTSFSSTSSSSSTSTTTLPPPYLDYTYQDYQPPQGFVKQIVDSGIVTSGTATTPTGNTTQGNTLIAVVRNLSSTNFTSMADSQGNTWTVNLKTTAASCNIAIVSAYLTTALTTSDTITGTATGSVNMQIYEYAGIAATSPFDKSNTSTGTALTLTTGSTGSLSNPNSLILSAAVTTAAQTFTVPNGYTEHLPPATTGIDIADLITTVGIARNTTWTWTSSVVSAVAIATFILSPAPPASSADLTAFTIPQYSNVSGDDGDYFIERGARFLIREYKNLHQNNTDNISFTWKGRSTLSTVTNPIFIQIYNVSTKTWETLAVANLVPADTDFQTTVTQSTNVANYYDTRNIVTFRSYQQVN